MRSRHFIFGGPLLIAVAGCSTFDGLSLSKEASSSSSAKCHHHASVKPRTDLGTYLAPTPDRVFALQTLDFGDGTNGMPKWDARSVGFDLDDTCTGEGEGPTCVPPPGAGIAQLDGPDGRDNAAGTLNTMHSDGGAAADPSNDVAKMGGATTIYRVSGYNGTSVDGFVEVAVYAARFAPPSKDVPMPLWLGDDVWSPFVDWVDAHADAGDAGDAGDAKAPAPMFKSSDAYVTNGTLVAKFDLIMLLPAVRLSGAMMEATIGQNAENLWTLSDGVFAARVNVDDSLQWLMTQLDPETHETLCRDSKSYELDKLRACSLADIPFSGNDPSKPCDGMSWAWKFDAVAAHLSPEVDPASLPTTDPCTKLSRPSPTGDHCDR